MDADSFPIPENRYGLIVNIRFLQRRLFPLIVAGLVPGGVLIFETFIDSTSRSGSWSPSRKEYLLREKELIDAFSGMEIVLYREVDTPEGTDGPRRIASLVARRPIK